MHNAVLVYRDERVLLIEIAITNKKIYISNVYAPQAKQDQIYFFAHVQHIMDSLNITNSLILLGDFNSVMNNNLDIVTGEKHNGLTVEALNKLTVDLDLHDCWRMEHGDEREYTWSRNQPFTARRLDYVFTSASLTSNCEY